MKFLTVLLLCAAGLQSAYPQLDSNAASGMDLPSASLEASCRGKWLAVDAGACGTTLKCDLQKLHGEATDLLPVTARLVTEVLATIDGSENGVHQRTLNRLTTFIDSFRSLNFAGDQQLEQTLERFRRDLLQRSAEDYRNDSSAMTSLTQGLNRLRENAVQLARSDAREIVARFGQMGGRRLAAVG